MRTVTCVDTSFVVLCSSRDSRHCLVPFAIKDVFAIFLSFKTIKISQLLLFILDFQLFKTFGRCERQHVMNFSNIDCDEKRFISSLCASRIWLPL